MRPLERAARVQTLLETDLHIFMFVSLDKDLQDCVLSVEMKWHTKKQVRCKVKWTDKSTDLISDCKPAPSPSTLFW